MFGGATTVDHRGHVAIARAPGAVWLGSVRLATDQAERSRV
ncbi:hypothetical protein ACQUFY_14490 [Robbsia andropogonis]